MLLPCPTSISEARANRLSLDLSLFAYDLFSYVLSQVSTT